MSFIDTGGRSSRFRTRAQNWAITSESAPRSSKKWLSTGTRSAPQTPASTSAEGPLERRAGGAAGGGAAGSAAARRLIVGCW